MGGEPASPLYREAQQIQVAPKSTQKSSLDQYASFNLFNSIVCILLDLGSFCKPLPSFISPQPGVVRCLFCRFNFLYSHTELGSGIKRPCHEVFNLGLMQHVVQMLQKASQWHQIEKLSPFDSSTT